MVLVLLVLGLDFQHKINIGTSELFLCTGPLRGKENKHMRGEGGVSYPKKQLVIYCRTCCVQKRALAADMDEAGFHKN